MQLWNWGPTTIWHNIECVTFNFFKSSHPTVQAAGGIPSMGNSSGARVMVAFPAWGVLKATMWASGPATPA